MKEIAIALTLDRILAHLPAHAGSRNLPRRFARAHVTAEEHAVM
jgi:hypothetical protein